MPSPAYVLRTARLGLRRYVAGDAAALLDVFADPYAAQFYPAMNDPLRIRKWIDWNLRNYDEFGFGLWAVERLSDGLFIGDTGLTMQTVEGVLRHEIGYHIHRDARGPGYAAEAARACLDFAFEHVGAGFVCSVVHPENVASAKVAQRVHASMREFEWHCGPFWLYSTTEAQRRSKRLYELALNVPRGADEAAG
jgi:RimJ/RimL family protein N-acetyltransferase